MIPAATAEVGGFLLLASTLLLYFCACFIVLSLCFGRWVQAEQSIEQYEEGFDYHGV